MKRDRPVTSGSLIVALAETVTHVLKTSRRQPVRPTGRRTKDLCVLVASDFRTLGGTHDHRHDHQRGEGKGEGNAKIADMDRDPGAVSKPSQRLRSPAGIVLPPHPIPP